MYLAFILISLIVLVSSIRRPLIGLCAMLLSLQMEMFVLGSLPAWLTLGRMAGFCAMVGWLVNRHKYRPTPLLASASLAGPSILFLVVTLIGALFALDVSAALSESIRVAMLFFLGIIVAETVETRRDLLALFWVIVLSTAVGAAAALLQFNAYQATGAMEGVYQAREGVRFEGLAGSANVLGIHLLSGIPFLFFLFYVFRQGWIRLVCMGLLGLTAFALILSVSRSNIYPLGAYVVATNVLHRKLGRHLVADNVLVAIAVGMLGLAVVESSDFVWERLKKPLVAREDESSGNIRLEILRQGPEIMAMSPIFGVGLRNTRQYTMRLEAHDTISALLGETGLFGTFFFVLFCIAVIRRQIGLMTRARLSGDPLFLELAVTLAGVLCILVVWIPVKVIYYQRLFWLWAGLVVWLDSKLRFASGAAGPCRVEMPSAGWPAPLSVRNVVPWGFERQARPQPGS